MHSTSTAVSLHWWRSQLPKYNIGLAVAGVLAFVAYLIVGHGFLPVEAEFEITLITLFVQGVGFLVMLSVANLCYLLGPLAEFFMKPQDPEHFRRVCFGLGFKFSMALPFSIPLLLAISVLFY